MEGVLEAQKGGVKEDKRKRDETSRLLIKASAHPPPSSQIPICLAHQPLTA